MVGWTSEEEQEPIPRTKGTKDSKYSKPRNRIPTPKRKTCRNRNRSRTPKSDSEASPSTKRARKRALASTKHKPYNKIRLAAAALPSSASGGPDSGARPAMKRKPSAKSLQRDRPAQHSSPSGTDSGARTAMKRQPSAEVLQCDGPPSRGIVMMGPNQLKLVQVGSDFSGLKTECQALHNLGLAFTVTHGSDVNEDVQSSGTAVLASMGKECRVTDAQNTERHRNNTIDGFARPADPQILKPVNIRKI